MGSHLWRNAEPNQNCISVDEDTKPWWCTIVGPWKKMTYYEEVRADMRVMSRNLPSSISESMTNLLYDG